MGVIWYGLDAKGVASANGTISNRNLLTARLYWQGLILDKFGQYYAGSAWGGDLFWPVFAALKEAKKNGGYAIRRSNTPAPMGTVFGIKTMWRAPDFLGSLETLDVPAYPVRPHSFGGGVTGCDVPSVLAMAPHGFLVRVHVWGTYTVIVAVNPIKNHLGQDDLWMHIVDESFGAPVCQYYHGNKPNPPNYPLFIEVALRTSPGVDPTFEPLVYYRLIHAKKINAEIYPPDQTLLGPGTQVNIIAEPLADDRVLTEFTVQSVDRLEEATKVYPDLSLPGITAPYGYDDERIACYTHGPVVADVYVTAVAEGVKIESEVPVGFDYTVQMTTTDCLVEPGSWEIAGSNLPETAIYSISTDGLVSIYIPEDVYDGNPGGKYYIDVTFNGYSQTKSLRLNLTLAPNPAYGTVWEAVTTLAEAPYSIFEASDKTVYVVGTTKVWKTTDLVTFDEVTLTGTVTGRLGNITEGPDGRLYLIDRGNIWLKEPTSEAFVEQAGWSFLSYWDLSRHHVSAHPDSNVIIHTGNINDVGVSARPYLFARNATTGALLHQVDAFTAGLNVCSFYALPAIRQADGSWVVSVPFLNGYKVYKYTEGVGFSLIVNGSTSIDGPSQVYADANGRLNLIGSKSKNTWFTRLSTDGGTTWSAEKLVNSDNLNSIIRFACRLRNDYLVAGTATNKVVRSDDGMTSYSTITTWGGDVTWIIKRRSGQLLAASNGGTPNLYKSEV